MAPYRDQNPFDTIYYDDEPDFLHQCSECPEVTAIPMHSIVVRQGVDGLNGYASGCHACGAQTPIQPRAETLHDGREAWTIDRQALLASGLEEWREEGVLQVSLVDRESGELVELAVSNSRQTWLVVCDDCGLPFEMKGNFAVTNRAGANLELNHVAGPCEHCGGFGRPLVTTAERDGLITHSNSADFAEGVLAHLAEQVRSGQIDVSEAAARLRAQRQPHLTRLADWIEGRPTSAMVAATLIAAVASLVGPQLPSMSDKDPEPPSRTTDGYSEQEVIDLVDTILDHYDKRTGQPQEREVPPAPKSREGGRQSHWCGRQLALRCAFGPVEITPLCRTPGLRIRVPGREAACSARPPATSGGVLSPSRRRGCQDVLEGAGDLGLGTSDSLGDYLLAPS